MVFKFAKDNYHNPLPLFFQRRGKTWKDVNETVYIVAGSSFQHTCSSKLDKINFWTFEATTAVGKSEVRATTDNLTFNKSIYIGNVRREDAGKYTCWMSSCVGHSIKRVTINLCVVTGEKHTNIIVS